MLADKREPSLAPLELARSVERRLAPGRGVAHARHLAVLAEVEPPASPVTWADSEAVALAVCFVARARRDALSQGAALITRYFDGVHLVRPGTLSSGVRSQLYASAGEYCNAIGWPQMGARFGAQALLFADSEPLRYRALSVTALGHALNGEYPAAECDLAAAEQSFAAHGWPAAETSCLVLLAHALVAAAQLDLDRLRGASERMALTQPNDAYTLFSARAVEAMSKMFDQDFSGGRAACRRLLNGSGRHASHRMVRHFLVCVLSDIMVAQGDDVDALAILEPFESPEGHGICFAMQRSAALLRLGRERELLEATEACVAREADHCLRTLTPILIRRALAWNRLGSSRRARDTMESGLLLIARTGVSAMPFLMLPHDETLRLIDDAAGAHPELQVVLPLIRATVDRVTLPDGQAGRPAALSALTRTERELAPLLLTSLSLVEIARERGVSLNTIKSQVRSIYQKLGVGGRAEAVERLTAADT